MRIGSENRESQVIIQSNQQTDEIEESKRGQRSHRAKKGEEKNAQKGSFFAGDMTNVSEIDKKKKAAQEKALKIVGDVYKTDKVMDDDLKQRQEKIKKLTEQTGEAQAELNKIEENREQLRISKGIPEDSTEEQDLKLLEKRSESMRIGSGVELTEEDNKRLGEIDQKGMTPYQEESLRYLAAGAPYRKEIENNTKAIVEENYIIRGMKQARLQANPMVEASQEADKYKEAAGKEIMGIIMDEVRKEADDKIEEEKKKQEEIQKKEEELKKKQEEQAPQKDVKQVQQQVQLDAQQEVKKIVEEMKLLQEDLKGAAIDALG